MGDEKPTSVALWREARQCLQREEVERDDHGRPHQTGVFLQEQGTQRLRASVELSKLAVQVYLTEMYYAESQVLRAEQSGPPRPPSPEVGSLN